MTAQEWDGRRVRVECPDGLPHHAQVYVVDAGGTKTSIPDLVSVTWTVRAEQLATVTLEIESAEIDAEGVGVVIPVPQQA